jgi:outer membrane receptor protein involved in Fe transport
MGRYIYQDQDTTGSGQSTPPGYESSNVSRNQGVNISLTSVLGPHIVNEGRLAFLRAARASVASDLRAEAIPSIQITSLGLQGLNAGATRTAIGLAANLPQASIRNTYQIQDNISYASGDHAFKFGGDIHRSQLHQLFKPTTRGHLVYSNLAAFVNDTANVQINRDLPGVARVLHLDWHDFFFYGQDEWKIRPNLTLTYGLRYELPGQPIADLVAHTPRGARRLGSPRNRATERAAPLRLPLQALGSQRRSEGRQRVGLGLRLHRRRDARRTRTPTVHERRKGRPRQEQRVLLLHSAPAHAPRQRLRPRQERTRRPRRTGRPRPRPLRRRHRLGETLTRRVRP